MRRLFKNWQFMLLVFLLIATLMLISFKGVQFGVDFRGGTLFQIHLAEPVKDLKQIESISSTIEHRLDWTGLKDVKVSVWGSDVEGVEFIIAQIAETRPEEVQKIKTLLMKQGKFEVMLDGNLMFEGEDILQIQKEVAKGYNYRPIQEGKAYEWTLPFTLTEQGSYKFTKAAFHKCAPVGYTPQGGTEYDCARTYFFIDRPSKSVLVLSQAQYEKDRQTLLAGDTLESIPSETKINELLDNTQLPYITFTDSLSEEDINQLIALREQNKFALVPENLEPGVKAKLAELNFIVKEIPFSGNEPWLWTASGARTVITLSEKVTNNKPYVEDFEQAKRYSNLIIRGYATDAAQAKKELEDLTILLESGSLPVPVDDISDETISPFLGKEFLFNAGLIGFFALVSVAVIIFVRYRMIKLALPIMFTAVCEMLLTLGFASLINWNLDLASVTGILAAVGTGVDDQIIITDELLKGVEVTRASLVQRIKNAFFIIIAAAATMFAVMSPIIFFGFGMGKLVGFALTTLAGILIGVLITRPAYGEILKVLLEK